MCIKLERTRFFRCLYYRIISIGCWVIVGQPVADEVAKRRSWDDDKPGGARTSGFRRDSGDTSSGLSAKIWMLTKPKSQSVGQTRTFEADSRGSDEVCGGYTGKGSLRA
jgi:hypothetical protein